MRINAIINRYIVRELLPPFGINLFFFTFIFLITKILEITNLVVNFQVSLLSFLLLLLYSMPFFLAFITPMSVMMAVLLTFLRMSGDNELVALQACGMNPRRFLIPVFVFCLLGWLLTTIRIGLARCGPSCRIRYPRCAAGCVGGDGRSNRRAVRCRRMH